MREIHLAATGYVRRLIGDVVGKNIDVYKVRSAFCGAQIPLREAKTVLVSHDDPTLCRTCLSALPGARSSHATGLNVQPLMWESSATSEAE